ENLVKVTEEEATKQLLKVGDYAKVVNATTNHQLSDGNIVEVIGNSGYHGNLRVKRLTDGISQNVPKEQLVKATDEEVAEAKRQAEEKATAARWA
ncbi:hypothetical protein PZE06_29225, partial [Robertmurraya sp. DFI.2.37]|nr:hypothetical protein [Robertmurraya sp. DFI.2.37]